MCPFLFALILFCRIMLNNTKEGEQLPTPMFLFSCAYFSVEP